MSRKISWKSVYRDFKQHYPNLSRETVHFRPYSYLTILLYFRDGMIATYDYTAKKATVLDKRWKQ